MAGSAVILIFALCLASVAGSAVILIFTLFYLARGGDALVFELGWGSVAGAG